jgi:glycine betaine transporter
LEEEKIGLEKFSEIKKTPTFLVALVITVVFVLFGVLAPGPFGDSMTSAFNWMVGNLGWSFILGASFFLFIIVFLLLSPVGEIKLGKDDEKPAYSNMTWFAMLFSCGMGIGLLFWGVSEPIWHYMWPPMGEAYSEASIHMAMRYSFFHWGFHPWAIYAVVAGALAYFSYRKGLPMLLSSTLEPILGRKGIEGGWGSLVNIIGVFATLFGLATSLGLGAMQIGGGMEMLFGIESTRGLWVVIIVVITAGAVLSTTSGIDRGIKWLSQINIVVAALLVLLVFVVGPTLFILNLFTHSVGDYLQNIIYMSFGLDAAGEHTGGWYGAWTVFYWAWWIAWAPFVGTFIARVSRGRTIRSFIVGVMLVPTAVSLVWFSVFGGSALFYEHFEGVAISEAVASDSALGFFTALQNFPASSLLIFIAMCSVVIFFTTSSDSGTYVNGMLTSGGNPNPPLNLRIIWGVSEGAIAAVLLFAGGLGALQTASILGGFPFMVIMVLMIYCLMKSLYAELREGSLPLDKKRVQDALDEIRKTKGEQVTG